jgi:hypothetical protein
MMPDCKMLWRNTLSAESMAIEFNLVLDSGAAKMAVSQMELT